MSLLEKTTESIRKTQVWRSLFRHGPPTTHRNRAMVVATRPCGFQFAAAPGWVGYVLTNAVPSRAMHTSAPVRRCTSPTNSSSRKLPSRMIASSLCSTYTGATAAATMRSSL